MARGGGFDVFCEGKQILVFPFLTLLVFCIIGVSSFLLAIWVVPSIVE